jgi:hypothetical protein
MQLPKDSGSPRRQQDIAQRAPAGRKHASQLRVDVPDTGPPARTAPAQRETKALASPAAVPAGQPRRHAASQGPYADYPQALCELQPSTRRSHELRRMYLDVWGPADQRQPRDLAFVPQSEGRASADVPLVSVGFAQCSAFFVKNLATGKVLLVHHDSSVRSWWDETGDGYEPVSPCTPTRGLLGRDRCGYTAFMAEAGPKVALLVESERAFDRREVLAKLASDGAAVLPPLKIETRLGGTQDDLAIWNVAYRPAEDRLMIHLRDGERSKVMHFPDIFAADPLPARATGLEPDIVDRIGEYKALLEEPGALSERARQVIDACLKYLELRSYRADLAHVVLKTFTHQLDLPEDIRRELAQGTMISRDGKVTAALTRLVAHVREAHPPPRGGFVGVDEYPGSVPAGLHV